MLQTGVSEGWRTEGRMCLLRMCIVATNSCFGIAKAAILRDSDIINAGNPGFFFGNVLVDYPLMLTVCCGVEDCTAISLKLTAPISG